MAMSMVARVEALERVGLDEISARAGESAVAGVPAITIEPFVTPATLATPTSTAPIDRTTVVNPGPALSLDAAQVGYRGWLHRGRLDFGLGVGVVVNRTSAPADSPSRFGTAEGVAFSALPDTVMTFGVRYRLTDKSAIYADAARLYSSGAREGSAKTGLELKGARSQWNLAVGGLGMQFADDTRLTLKLRKGGVVLAVRRTF